MGSPEDCVWVIWNVFQEVRWAQCTFVRPGVSVASKRSLGPEAGRYETYRKALPSLHLIYPHPKPATIYDVPPRFQIRADHPYVGYG